jgi:hypothetical protein
MGGDRMHGLASGNVQISNARAANEFANRVWCFYSARAEHGRISRECSEQSTRRAFIELDKVRTPWTLLGEPPKVAKKAVKTIERRGKVAAEIEAALPTLEKKKTDLANKIGGLLEEILSTPAEIVEMTVPAAHKKAEIAIGFFVTAIVALAASFVPAMNETASKIAAYGIGAISVGAGLCCALGAIAMEMVKREYEGIKTALLDGSLDGLISTARKAKLVKLIQPAAEF